MSLQRGDLGFLLGLAGFLLGGTGAWLGFRSVELEKRIESFHGILDHDRDAIEGLLQRVNDLSDDVKAANLRVSANTRELELLRATLAELRGGAPSKDAQSKDAQPRAATPKETVPGAASGTEPEKAPAERPSEREDAVEKK